MDTAISIENVGKSYVIRHKPTQRYSTLRDAIMDLAKGIGKGVLPYRRHDFAPATKEIFWALKDISFEVKVGDRLGIIGRNGAGKSTLLKVLSRITEPTSGRIMTRGRLASLLEVGTGFHPELTGRENIFLNGTILGMTVRDIRRKFDEIVAFAEIERFLDTPVKHYSSGMYVRLAFAVAAHLESDILVIDEVLAVGDAQFQKKCMGKMGDVTREGRTVLFVSHNMTTVTSLCNRCLLLERGQVKAVGGSAEIASLYFQDPERTGSQLSYPSPDLRPGDSAARLVSGRLVDCNLGTVDHTRLDQSIGVEMKFEMLRGGLAPVPNMHVFSQGQYAFVSIPPVNNTLERGTYTATMWIPPRLLNDGQYVIGIALSSLNPTVVHFFEQDALQFSVIDDLSDPRRNGYMQGIPGIVRPQLEWDSTTKID